MTKVVFDTTVLVSAFLKPVRGGASYDLLRSADEGAFDLYVSEDILEETTDVLLNRKRIRQRYGYLDDDVVEFCREVSRFATVFSGLPEISGVVTRDPTDDNIVACAVAAGAEYIVTRDKDLLSLGEYQRITMITPEAFLHVLRGQT